MIDTQLHNRLIDLEIERKIIEAKKIVQETKTQVLKERLTQALYIAGFLFIIFLMLILLFRFLPKGFISPSTNINDTFMKDNKIKKKNTNIKQYHQKKHLSKESKKVLNGIEYVKENNFIYKRIYKDGNLIKEKKLAPTILESKKIKNENIPQFSTLKKGNSAD